MRSRLAGYESHMTPVRTLAHAMLAAIFVKSGADAVMMPERLVPRAAPLADKVGPALSNVHPALSPDTKTFVQVNGAVQAAAGALLLTRWSRPAAVVLAGSLVPTTIAGHAFWAQGTPADRSAQLTHFLKNVGLFGGLLLAAVDTGGRPGLRWRAEHLARDANKAVRRTAQHQKAKANIAMKAAAAGRKFPS
jgi:putative oxidoreductase